MSTIATAAEALTALYIDGPDTAEKTSYLEASGADNAVIVGDRMICIGDDEDLATWATYQRDGDEWVLVSEGGGTPAEAVTAGTQFLA